MTRPGPWVSPQLAYKGLTGRKVDWFPARSWLPMRFFDVLWHLLGFAAVPVLLGLLAATSAKLIWRRELGMWPWWKLAASVCGICLFTAVAGLVCTGHDGAMVTYGAMVLACALALWWPLRRG